MNSIKEFPFNCPPPRYIFGAGEMADHIISLLLWMRKPICQIELFDDAFPLRRTGPAGLPIVANFVDGLSLSLAEQQPVMVAAGGKGAAIRWALCQRLLKADVPFSSAVHSSLIISPGADPGRHLIAMPGCTLGKNVLLGTWTCLHSNVAIEHDTKIGDNVLLGPGTVTGGHVTIGRHAFVGVGVSIAPGVNIGERALIGAGSVVVRDIPEGVIAMGTPARVHRVVPEGAESPTLEALARACFIGQSI